MDPFRVCEVFILRSYAIALTRIEISVSVCLPVWMRNRVAFTFKKGLLNMKRNGRNLKMPKDCKMTSDIWSQMTNLERYDYLNGRIAIEALSIKYIK